MMASLECVSPTSAMSDIYEQKRKDLDDYLDHFKAVENQVGVLVMIDGKVMGSDSFGYQETLEQLFVYDARDYAEPLSFGYSLSNPSASAAEFPSYSEPCAVVFSLRDMRVDIAMGMGLLGLRMLAINATDGDPTGRGFLARDTPAIHLTPKWRRTCGFWTRHAWRSSGPTASRTGASVSSTSTRLNRWLRVGRRSANAAMTRPLRLRGTPGDLSRGPTRT